MAEKYVEQRSYSDPKEHYGVIILGCGLSGLAATIQLKRKLGFTDSIVYEKSGDIGGTWNHNRYPGAACDIPLSLYSYSFAPPKDVPHQWAAQPAILGYLHSVQRKFNVDNIAFHHLVKEARFSRKTGHWTVTVENQQTGETKTRTCNILISALGGLANPNLPPFNPDDFDGSVFHSAQWDHSVDIKGKDVVIVGNGCSAAQIVPEIVNEVGSLTQIARSKQSVIRRPLAPDSAAVHFCKKYIPGFAFILRALIFLIMESHFLISDVNKGKKMRQHVVKDTEKYMKSIAPEKYWDDLTPDFDIAAKRRIFDSGYYKATNAPNFELLQGDSVTNVKGDQVFTKNGKQIRADVIVLSTGFRVHDYLFPLKVYNSEGVSLQDRLRETKVSTYRGTAIADFPNFMWLMGPNTATGHSSVIFTSEAQLSMICTLVKPLLEKTSQLKLHDGPAPTIEVSQEAQDAYNESVRKQMQKKVWEANGGVSWYVDQKTGLCTALYPWSQVHYWWYSTWGLRKSDFVYKGL